VSIVIKLFINTWKKMYPSWIFCLLCIVIAQNCAIFTKDYKPIDF